MKVLLVSARTPTLAGKGDQVRAAQLVEALAADHEVAVVTTAAGVRAADERSVGGGRPVTVRRPTRAGRALGAAGALLRGQPGQVGWMMPGPVWRSVRERARDADVVIAVTARSLRGPLPIPVVLDHVDALSLNLERRGYGPEPLLVRWAARAEAVLLRRWERRLSRTVAAQVAISAVDAGALPATPRVHVVPNRVDVLAVEPTPVERDLDVILTGNMAYPPNADAARWLSDAIAPAIWRRRPETGVWVVGRRAGELPLDPRIEVRADVPEIAAYLRRAKVALAPLRIGTGSPNKVLEAIAAGAVVAATPAAVAPFALGPDAVLAEDGADELAAGVVRLLHDADARQELATRGRALLASHTLPAQRAMLAAILAEATAGTGS